ncbi:alpha/beta hydrolase [Roseateles oligotrophus]|uniref:Alpha/beta hydrolase n=1 Tax=Roseateles oligotrophus TaxID=1769250 RepID=A0ABT2YHY9_9BURK|nr:alpha/beta hydrolase [Roseateles oligotrophus]MCV2369664.1 alpha/beta hydrolase [Roseateles oligotrophus]
MSKLHFNADTPLYTSDGKAWRIDQLDAALHNLEAANKPVILFVHGRGKEPSKSLKGGTFTKGLAVHKLELGYDAKVLMFNWDSAFEGLHFLDRELPLSHTEAAAKALGLVLEALIKHQTAQPKAKKMALLVHSMGSIVVEKAVEKGYWPGVKGLFSALLFSQPDADDVGHSVWLNRLAQREKVYVTLNADDHVLLRSTDGRIPGRHALGLGTEDALAPLATYVDLSRMGPLGKKDEDHEVFGKGAMNGQLHVCHFFEQVLKGQPVQLDPAANVEAIEREVIYRLKSRQEPSNPCLKIPKLPGD